MFQFKSLVFLDTEATSDGRGSEVVELAIAANDGRLLFHSLFHPSRPMSPKASCLTGITDDMLKNAPRFADHVDIVQSIIAGKVVVGHGILSDMRFIRQTMRHQHVLNKSFFASRTFDTRVFAQAITFPESGNLERLAHVCGCLDRQPHRALGDCLMTRYVFNTLFQYALETLGKEESFRIFFRTLCKWRFVSQGKIKRSRTVPLH